MFGLSEAMKKVQRDVAMIASADVPVLIQGPSERGKEIIARMIYRASPFAKVNSARGLRLATSAPATQTQRPAKERELPAPPLPWEKGRHA